VGVHSSGLSDADVAKCAAAVSRVNPGAVQIVEYVY
jgi:hypothetical protein